MESFLSEYERTGIGIGARRADGGRPKPEGGKNQKDFIKQNKQNVKQNAGKTPFSNKKTKDGGFPPIKGATKALGNKIVGGVPDGWANAKDKYATIEDLKLMQRDAEMKKLDKKQIKKWAQASRLMVKVKHSLKRRVGEVLKKHEKLKEEKKLEKINFRLKLRKAMLGKVKRREAEIKKEEKELDDIIATLRKEDQDLKEKEKKFAKEKKKIHWYRDEEDARMRERIRYLRSKASMFDKSEMTNPNAHMDDPEFKDAVEAALGEDMSGHIGSGAFGAIKKTAMWKKLVKDREDEEKKIKEAFGELPFGKEGAKSKAEAKTTKGFDWGGMSEEDKKKKKALLREIEKHGNAGGPNDEGKAFMKKGFIWD